MIITSSFTAEFAADVRRDLALEPKQLQSKYLYDALGSSLFEAICRLPWYRITRAESRLLEASRRRHRRRARRPGRSSMIVELGCGSGEKLVDARRSAAGRRRLGARAPDRHLVAGARADRAAPRPGSQHFSVVGHQSTYEVGLRRAAAARDGDGPMLVLLLGSNIGNFDAPAALDFLRRIRLALEPGDLLLLGADLVKPEPELRLAYDDPLGVTAAFNKNLLVRINRELGGNFDLDAFDHRRRLERGAAAHRDAPRQPGRADGHRHGGRTSSVTFAPGERIWTESSYKYEPHQIETPGRRDRLRHAPSVDRRGRALRAVAVRRRSETTESGVSRRRAFHHSDQHGVNGETEQSFCLFIQRLSPLLRGELRNLLRIADPLPPSPPFPPAAKAPRAAGRYPIREHQARARRHRRSMGEARAE